MLRGCLARIFQAGLPRGSLQEDIFNNMIVYISVIWSVNYVIMTHLCRFTLKIRQVFNRIYIAFKENRGG